MTKTTFRLALGVSATVVLLLLGLAWHHFYIQGNAEASRYFANVLKNSRVTETVTVGGVSYSIADGTVSSANHTVSAPEEFLALRTAYAVLVAERSPLFGIEGVDPEALKRAVGALQAAQKSAADIQESAQSATVTGSLYPINFLTSLAELEKARQTFLSVKSDTALTAYDQAMRQTIADGLHDSGTFAGALRAVIADKQSFRFPGLGGSITKQDLLNSAAQVQTRMSEVKNRFARRQQCLSGQVDICNPGILTLQYPQLSATSTAVVSPFASEIQSIFDSTNPGSAAAAGSVITLSESTCVSMHPPYVFFLFAPGEGRTPLRYLGDIFFTATEHSNGPVLPYLKEKYDIAYSYQNVVQSYICPDVGTDIGTANAVQKTAEFAKQFPAVAQAEQKQFMGARPLDESAAITYLRAAGEALFAEAQPNPEETVALQKLLLVWQEKSAGLDALVQSVATVIRTDTAMRKNGVPISVDAGTLFMTHSVFPSLFLTQNSSAGVTGITLREKKDSDLAAYLSSVVRYSKLRDITPHEKIIHDISAFNLFELSAK